MKTQLLSLGLALVSLNTSISAQESAETKPAIAIYSGGLEQFLADKDDAGLLQILGYLDERIMELAEELGESPPPRPLLDLFLDIARAPQALRLGIGDLSQGLTPDVVWAQIDVKSDDVQQAKDLALRLEGALEMLPFPLTEQADRPGLKFIDMGNGMGVHLGARQESDQSGTYMISFGAPRLGDMRLVDYGMPAGSRALFAMGIDLAKLQPAIQVGLSMAGEQAEMLRPQLERFNLIGEEAWGMTLAVGVADERMHTNMRMSNWTPLAKKLNLFVDQTLSAKDFRMLPADAQVATLQVRNASAVLDQLRSLTAESAGISGEELIAMAEGFLGINLESDLFRTFGHVQGLYSSESTGGGGLASTVFFTSMDDDAQLRKTMGFLSDNFLGLAKGRLRFSKWNHRGIECTTINTPGLPVPMEISMAFSQGYLFTTLNRSALMGALDNAESAGPGLLGLASVKKELPHSLESAISFSYGDSHSMVREGYSSISLLYSALANAVLSPSDEGRTFGMIMPAYGNLMQRVAPQVAMGWIEGDDLCFETSSSPSLTANLACLAGNPMLTLLMPLTFAGAGVGWFMGRNPMRNAPTSQEAAALLRSVERAQAGADLEMLSNAVTNYMIDNNGRAPATLEELLQGPDGHAYLWTESVPMDPWGNPYHYQAPDMENDVELVIYSLGSDGVQGGYGEEGDIDHLMVKYGDY